jgi:hypothetical protein
MNKKGVISMNKNFQELLRDIEVIANHKYTGDVFLSKVRGMWKVELRPRDLYGSGQLIIQAGEGTSLERALENACRDELDKVKNDLEHNQELLKRFKSNGR